MRLRTCRSLPTSPTCRTPFTQGEQNRSEPLFGRYHAFLPAGNHTLRFTLAGYTTQDVPVTVTANGSVMMDVQLQPPGLSFTLPERSANDGRPGRRHDRARRCH